jgi:hypothetical protein
MAEQAVERVVMSPRHYSGTIAEQVDWEGPCPKLLTSRGWTFFTLVHRDTFVSLIQLDDGHAYVFADRMGLGLWKVESTSFGLEVMGFVCREAKRGSPPWWGSVWIPLGKDRVRTLAAEVKAMEPVFREEFFEELRGEVCFHCGGRGGCRCWDDE